MYPDLLFIVHTITRGEAGSIIINFEAQRYIDPHVLDRLLSYSTRIYAGQKGEGLPYPKYIAVWNLVLLASRMKQFHDYGLAEDFICHDSLRCDQHPHALVLNKLRTFLIDKTRVKEILFNRSKIDNILDAWLLLLFFPAIVLEDRFWDFCQKENIMADAAETIYEISHRQGIINAARSFDNQQAVYDSLLYHAEQKGKSRK